ncbi:hypothetical protein PHMEG_00026290 [Phytophthora megakarya]|uniref:DUF7492 domain-containing protein n=1 Tax=Phytophthora megakarya TaxID=4795 RepID=A0A225VA29_9STRA|nr:hypothetical protein PHMEG_00026290 [Phytophthora megakarya]
MRPGWFDLAVLTAVVQSGRYLVTAHSWIDCFDTNYTKIYDQSASYIYGGSGGNGFCDGYGAGYPGRGDTSIGTEYTFKMLENEVEAGTAVCETVDADTYTNTDWRKRLSVAPGVKVYFAYLPNGHIVKDKKAIGTQHGIYWTGQVGTSLSSTLEMTTENLMDGYTMNYDDGNCGETYDYNGNPGGRAGDGKPCIGSFVVPTGTAPGIYSMVWYWTFWLDDEAAYVDQSQARGYFGAAYSTCFEVEVTSGSGTTTTTDAPSTNAPEATTFTPQATTDIPQSTTETPATETPTPTTSAPASSSIKSWDQVDSNTAAGDADLTSTTSPPVSTTSAPQETTAAPIAQTSTPVATYPPTQAPETPAPITTAPVVNVQTEAPITTSPPLIETNAPITETPGAITYTPVATTSLPLIETSAPEIITSAPVSVTDLPTTETPEVATNSPEVVTDSPAALAPSTTADQETITPTKTPETDTSDELDDGYSSLDSVAFSSFDGDGSVGTVHGASTSSSGSTSPSFSSSSSMSSDKSAAEVGSDSYDIDPQVSDESVSASGSSEASSASSTGSSTTSASANAETSFSVKSSQFLSWLVLVPVIIATTVSF